MKKISVQEARASDLAAYAQTHLGLLDINYRIGKDAVLAEMAKAGFDGDEIEIDDAPAPVASAPADIPAQGEEKVTINIAAQEGPGGSEPVFVSVNGSAMLIPRGKDVPVPKRYYEVLRTATRMVYDPNPEGGLMPPREVPQYPFQRVA